MSRSLIYTLLAALMLPMALMAQPQSDSRKREAWLKEMQQYKNEYISRIVNLTDEQKAQFLPVYAKMDAELRAVGDQTFRLAREVRKKGDKATDLEVEKAAEAQYELKCREGEIEMKYYRQFKTILSPSQLLKLKGAEKDFTRELMNHSRNAQKQGHRPAATEGGRRQQQRQ